jgi:hypothetical protein
MRHEEETWGICKGGGTGLRLRDGEGSFERVVGEALTC